METENEQVEVQCFVHWDSPPIYDDYCNDDDIKKVSSLPDSQNTCNTCQVFDESPRNPILIFPLKDEHFRLC